MKNNHSLPFSLSIALAAASFSLAAPAATVTRTIVNDGSSVALYNPAVATAADGTLHICAQGRTATTPYDQATSNIYWSSVSSSGTIRAATQVNTADTTARDGRCKIAVTAAGKVVVTWGGNNETVKAVLLNPAAAPASLIEVAETAVSTTTGGHHSIAIDGNGKVHVIISNTTALRHVRFAAATLVPDVADHAIGTAFSSVRQVDVGLGIDSNNRLHVVYSAEDINAQGPAAYMMLDDSGVIRIAPTALFQRSGVFAHASHFTVMVESPTLVHVVYGDKRNTTTFGNWSEYHTGGSAIYTRLNPSLDDQSGDAATLATITVGTEQLVGNFWYGQAFLNSGTVHFVAGQETGGGNINHVAITGGAVGEPKSIAASNGSWSQSKWYVRGAGSNVVWTDVIYSPTLTGMTTQLVRAGVSEFASRDSGTTIIQDDGGCTLAKGPKPVDPTLWVLALLAALYLYRRRGFAQL